MGASLVQVFAANQRSGKQATTSLRTPSSLPLVGPSGHHARANQHEPSCSKRPSGATARDRTSRTITPSMMQTVSSPSRLVAGAPTTPAAWLAGLRRDPRPSRGTAHT